MRSTFRVLFYINRSKIKNGIAPIMGRITVNGTIAQFSCRCSINPSLWDVSANRVKGKSIEAAAVNQKLDNLRASIFLSYNKMLIDREIINAVKIKNDFLGLGNEKATLLGTIEKDLAQYSKRVNLDRSKTTYQKMQIVARHLKRFLERKVKTDDIYLSDLNEEFIKNFSTFLQYDKGLAQSTVWVYCTYLKKIGINAYNNGIIKHNPFYNFRISPNVKEREFLTEDV